MNILQPWQLLLVCLAGWINRQQRDVIEYIQEENRVLRCKLFLYDASEQSLMKNVDVSSLRGTFDWKKFERTFDVPKETKSGAVMFVMVLDGTAWMDDIQVTPVGSVETPSKRPLDTAC